MRITENKRIKNWTGNSLTYRSTHWHFESITGKWKSEFDCVLFLCFFHSAAAAESELCLLERRRRLLYTGAGVLEELPQHPTSTIWQNWSANRVSKFRCYNLKSKVSRPTILQQFRQNIFLIFSQLGVTHWPVTDLILTRSDIQTRLITDSHFCHFSHTHFCFEIKYEMKWNNNWSGCQIPLFLNACFQRMRLISSTQDCLTSGFVASITIVSFGFRFRNHISNLVLDSPILAVKPMSDVFMLCL